MPRRNIIIGVVLVLLTLAAAIVPGVIVLTTSRTGASAQSGTLTNPVYKEVPTAQVSVPVAGDPHRLTRSSPLTFRTTEWGDFIDTDSDAVRCWGAAQAVQGDTKKVICLVVPESRPASLPWGMRLYVGSLVNPDTGALGGAIWGSHVIPSQSTDPIVVMEVPPDIAKKIAANGIPQEIVDALVHAADSAGWQPMPSGGMPSKPMVVVDVPDTLTYPASPSSITP